jgi:hypothetical protein
MEERRLPASRSSCLSRRCDAIFCSPPTSADHLSLTAHLRLKTPGTHAMRRSTATILYPAPIRRFRDKSAPTMQERKRGTWDLAVLGCCCLLVQARGNCRSSPPEQERSAKRSLGASARSCHDISARSWPVAPTPLCTYSRSALVRRLLHLQLSSLHVCTSRSRRIQHDMCERPPFGAKGRTMT